MSKTILEKPLLSASFGSIAEKSVETLKTLENLKKHQDEGYITAKDLNGIVMEIQRISKQLPSFISENQLKHSFEEFRFENSKMNSTSAEIAKVTENNIANNNPDALKTLESDLKSHVKTQLRQYVSASDLHGLIHEVQRLSESHKHLSDEKYDVKNRIAILNRKMAQIEQVILNNVDAGTFTNVDSEDKGRVKY